MIALAKNLPRNRNFIFTLATYAGFVFLPKGTGKRPRGLWTYLVPSWMPRDTIKLVNAQVICLFSKYLNNLFVTVQQILERNSKGATRIH